MSTIKEKGVFCPMDKECDLNSDYGGNLEYCSGTYLEKWICNICSTEFEVPADFETIGDEINCDTIERDWSEGYTIIESDD